MLLSHLNTVTDLILWRAFVHLDDNPIRISADDSLTEREVIFFDGPIETGKHEVSFVLIFKSKKEDEDAQWSVKGEFAFLVKSSTKTVQLKTFQNQNGKIMTHYEDKSLEKGDRD